MVSDMCKRELRRALAQLVPLDDEINCGGGILSRSTEEIEGRIEMAVAILTVLYRNLGGDEALLEGALIEEKERADRETLLREAPVQGEA